MWCDVVYVYNNTTEAMPMIHGTSTSPFDQLYITRSIVRDNKTDSITPKKNCQRPTTDRQGKVEIPVGSRKSTHNPKYD